MARNSIDEFKRIIVTTLANSPTFEQDWIQLDDEENEAKNEIRVIMNDKTFVMKITKE